MEKKDRWYSLSIILFDNDNHHYLLFLLFRIIIIILSRLRIRPWVIFFSPIMIDRSSRLVRKKNWEKVLAFFTNWFFILDRICWKKIDRSEANENSFVEFIALLATHILIIILRSPNRASIFYHWKKKQSMELNVLYIPYKRVKLKRRLSLKPFKKFVIKWL